jgi:hypothetical protein
VGLTESVEAIPRCTHGYPKHRITVLERRCQQPVRDPIVGAIPARRVVTPSSPARIPAGTRAGLPWPEATGRSWGSYAAGSATCLSHPAGSTPSLSCHRLAPSRERHQNVRPRSSSRPRRSRQSTPLCGIGKRALPGRTVQRGPRQWRTCSSKVQQQKRNLAVVDATIRGWPGRNDAYRGPLHHFASKGLGVRVPLAPLSHLVSGTLAARINCERPEHSSKVQQRPQRVVMLSGLRAARRVPSTLAKSSRWSLGCLHPSSL